MKEILNITQYAKFTDTTAIYPEDVAETYICAGITEEIGEVAGLFKRWVRDESRDVSPARFEELKAKYKAELGDILWYLARYARHHSLDMQYMAATAYFNWDNIAAHYGKQDMMVIGYSIQDMTEQLANLNNSIAMEEEIGVSEENGAGLLLELIKIANVFDLTLKDIYLANVAKLTARKENNTLKGKGDDR